MEHGITELVHGGIDIVQVRFMEIAATLPSTPNSSSSDKNTALLSLNGAPCSVQWSAVFWCMCMPLLLTDCDPGCLPCCALRLS